MATRDYFFDAEDDGGTPDRQYKMASWAHIFSHFVSDGFRNQADEPEVTPNDPTDMTVLVNPMVVWIQGRYFEIYSEAEELAVPASESSVTRWDRVVVRLDEDDRSVTVAVKEGTPDAGIPPALTQTDTVWEMSVAKIQVAAGVTSITASNITMEHDDPDLMGESALLGEEDLRERMNDLLEQYESAFEDAIAADGITRLTEAERDALSGGDLWTGRTIYNLTTDIIEAWDGSVWSTFPVGTAVVQKSGDVMEGTLDLDGNQLDQAELHRSRESYSGNPGTTSGTFTLDAEVAHTFRLQTDGDITINIDNLAGEARAITLRLGVGASDVVTWDSAIEWPDGEVPDLGGWSLLTFFSTPGQTGIYGMMAGSNFA